MATAAALIIVIIIACAVHGIVVLIMGIELVKLGRFEKSRDGKKHGGLKAGSVILFVLSGILVAPALLIAVGALGVNTLIFASTPAAVHNFNTNTEISEKGKELYDGFEYDGYSYTEIGIFDYAYSESDVPVVNTKGGAKSVLLTAFTPSTLFRVENDGGFELLSYENRVFCREEEYDIIRAYYEDYDGYSDFCLIMTDDEKTQVPVTLPAEMFESLFAGRGTEISQIETNNFHTAYFIDAKTADGLYKAELRVMTKDGAVFVSSRNNDYEIREVTDADYKGVLLGFASEYGE